MHLNERLELLTIESQYALGLYTYTYSIACTGLKRDLCHNEHKPSFYPSDKNLKANVIFSPFNHN